MSDISTDKLRKEIEDILSVADLATTSAKKVRLELEKKLGVELSTRKKEIDSLVMDYVNKQPATPESESNSDKEEEEKAEEEEEDDRDRRSLKRKAAEDSGKAKKGKAKKDKKEENGSKKSKKGGGGGNGYTRAVRLSPALAELMGQEEMPRHEVVKRVWAIIKERNLYDPNNKQFAVCDESLQKVIGCKRFRTFGMMKYLKNHFYG